MELKSYVIREKLNITGRGIIFVIDLSQFDELPDHIYNRKDLDQYVKVGDRFMYQDVTYEIRGLEMSMKLMDPPFIWKRDSIGLQCREIPAI